MAKESKSRRNLFSKLFSQTGTSDEEEEQNPDEEGPKSGLTQFKFVFFIVDWNQVKKVSGVFEAGNVAFHFINKGKGTASSEILDLLGIGANDKAVIVCLCRPESVHPLMKEVRKKLNYRSPGAGIAFAVPLSAINSPVLKVLNQLDTEMKSAEHPTEHSLPDQKDTARPHDGNDNWNGIERRSGNDRRGSGEKQQPEEVNTPKEFTHDLIFIVVNQGYSDELMNDARAAGAFGGTVLNARGQAHEGAVKFLGISVQDEKEIILILSTREKKTPIMETVIKNRGLNSKAQGIVFSLPVENVMGLSFE